MASWAQTLRRGPARGPRPAGQPRGRRRGGVHQELRRPPASGRPRLPALRARLLGMHSHGHRSDAGGRPTVDPGGHHDDDEPVLAGRRDRLPGRAAVRATDEHMKRTGRTAPAASASVSGRSPLRSVLQAIQAGRPARWRSGTGPGWTPGWWTPPSGTCCAPGILARRRCPWRAAAAVRHARYRPGKRAVSARPCRPDRAPPAGGHCWRSAYATPPALITTPGVIKDTCTAPSDAPSATRLEPGRWLAVPVSVISRHRSRSGFVGEQDKVLPVQEDGAAGRPSPVRQRLRGPDGSSA